MNKSPAVPLRHKKKGATGWMDADPYSCHELTAVAPAFMCGDVLPSR